MAECVIFAVVKDDDDVDSDSEWQPLISMSCAVTILQSVLIWCSDRVY